MKHLSNKKIIAIIAVITLVLVGTGFVLVKRNNNQYPEDYPWSCPEDWDPGECATIEDHAKVDVSQRQETIDLVKEYGSDKVTVRALAYEYITDDSYIDRLFGDRFSEVECVIFVDWPDGRRIYVEIDYHKYEQFTQEQFDEVVSGADVADIQSLYDNLH